MDEYDPDKTTYKNSSKSQDFDGENVKRVPIDNRDPLSETNPKYKDKYEEHLKMQIPMYLCPDCHHLGCHKVTNLDQPATGIRIGGEVCDICGYQDTFEYGG